MYFYNTQTYISIALKTEQQYLNTTTKQAFSIKRYIKDKKYDA